MFAEARIGVLVALGLSGFSACGTASAGPAVDTSPPPVVSAPQPPPWTPPPPSCPTMVSCVAEETVAPSDPAPAPYGKCHTAAPRQVFAPPGQTYPGEPPHAGFDAAETAKARTRVTSPMANACCYTWTGPCMGGRAFRPDGHARVADVEPRADWQSRFVATAPEPFRARLAAAWTRAAQDEHASIAAFNLFSMQLLGLGAPARLVADAQRAAMDEVEHARLCFALASAYGDEPIGPGRLAMSSAVDVDLVAFAVATFVDGCVGEGAAALIAREAAAGCVDPHLRAALTRLADDEQRHAELAWSTVAWAVHRGGLDVAVALRVAFAGLASVDAPEAPAGDLVAWGRLDVAREAHIRAQSIADVVAPCLTALLERTDVGQHSALA